MEKDAFLIYQDDCIQRMKTFEDNSVDLVVCDLPYGRTKNRWDAIIPFDELWEQYNRICKEDCVFVLFCDGLFQVDLINSNRKNWRYNLVWEKVLTSGFLNAKKMPLRSHEEIAVFYRKPGTYNPQMTQGEPLHSRGKTIGETAKGNKNFGDYKIVEQTYDGLKYPKSVLTFPRAHASKMVHPTEKPVELLRYLVRTYSNPGEVVLDNCMGSGSTGVACVLEGRKFIGIEIDEKYFKLSEDRIKDAYYTRENPWMEARVNNE